jgi:hypothetical protein
MTRRIINLVIGTFSLGVAGVIGLLALIIPGPYDWINAILFGLEIFVGIFNLGIYFAEP